MTDWPGPGDTERFEGPGQPIFDSIMNDARRELLTWANTPEPTWRGLTTTERK